MFNKMKKGNQNFISQSLSNHSFSIPKDMPDIHNILSMVVEPVVLSFRTINTAQGISSEGFHLTGKKAVVEIHLKQKILYQSNADAPSIYVLEQNIYETTYISIPPSINGTSCEALIEHDYIKPKIYIKNTFMKTITSRSLFVSVVFLTELFQMPTYTLCYLQQNQNGTTDLLFAYEDLSHGHKVKHLDLSLKAMAKWSPTGQELTYLKKNKEGYSLYSYNLKDSIEKSITDLAKFKSITSYCWDTKGDNIILSSYMKGYKELFIININTLQSKQLTFSNGIANSYRPKSSPKGTKIAFLKSISKVPQLYMMNYDGLDCGKVATSGYILDFAWSPDSHYIAYSVINEGKENKLFILDLEHKQEKSIQVSYPIHSIRHIKFSPCHTYIGFVASSLSTENLFTHNIKEDKTINLTKNYSNVTISSWSWNSDGSKLFYAANDLFYYNIYGVSLEDYKSHQLTNLTTSHIEISYRTKII